MKPRLSCRFICAADTVINHDMAFPCTFISTIITISGWLCSGSFLKGLLLGAGVIVGIISIRLLAIGFIWLSDWLADKARECRDAQGEDHL